MMTFDSQTLADDLCEVHDMYARFFTRLDETSWDKPVKGSPKEWNLHETITHLLFFRINKLFSVDVQP